MSDTNDLGQQARELLHRVAGDKFSQDTPPRADGLDTRIDENGKPQLGNPAMRAAFRQRGDRTVFDEHGREAVNPIRHKVTGAILLQGATIANQSPEANRRDAALKQPSKLAQADIKGLDFSNRQIGESARLDGADASGCKFDKATVRGSAAGAILDGASMVGSDCRQLRAPRASFRDVVATGARFSGDLRETEWTGAVLDNCHFSYPCDLRGSKIMETAKSLKGCTFDPGVKIEDTSYLDRKYK